MQTLKHKKRNPKSRTKNKIFIVLARPRTGSTLLNSYLRSHPAITSEGEIMARLDGRSHWEVLKDAFTAQKGNPQIKARGFKLFYKHPFDADPDTLFRALAGIPYLHVIRLRRKNVLRSLVSLKMAMAQDQWCIRNPGQLIPAEQKRTRMSVEELRRRLEHVTELEENCDRYFGNHPLLTVVYENMVQAPTQTFNSICDFLDLEKREPESRLIKQNPEPLSELLENYGELEQAFSNTRWKHLFSG